MPFRRFIPLVATLFAAYLCGGSASRLHLLAVFLLKLTLILGVAAMFLFVIRRSTSICRVVLLDSFLSPVEKPACSLLWRLNRGIGEAFIASETPDLPARFQRPPPAFSR